MKKIILTLLLAIPLANIGFAQTLKGSKMIGGSGNIPFDNGIFANLLPSFGYFVMDDLAVGSGIQLGYQTYKFNHNKYISGGFQPFVRYYFGQPASIRVFAHANGAIGYGTAIGKGDKSVIYDTRTSSIGGGLGMVYFITEQVGLEGLLNYVNYKNTYTGFSNPMGGSRNNAFNISFGIQVHLPTSTKE